MSAVLLAFLLCYVQTPMVHALRPEGVSPSLQPDPKGFAYPDNVTPATGFFGGGTGVTSVIWVRWNKPDLSTARFFPVISGSVSYETARATREGGPGLVPLGTARFETPLVLTGGAWSEQCLPATYDCPDTLADKWGYGCYCINILTDTPCTVTVGGEEIYFGEDSVGEKVVRNVKPTSADRSVSVVAESEDAEIFFGIAELPLSQFCGQQLDGERGNGTIEQDPDYGGVYPDVWRMFVVRSVISNGFVRTRVECHDECGLMPQVADHTEEMWHPRSLYEANSRLRWNLFSMNRMDNVAIDTFGFKLWNRWVDDDLLSGIRIADMKEIEKRGFAFPKIDPDYFDIRFDQGTVVSHSETVVETDEEKVESQTATTVPTATLYIVPGLNNDHGFRSEDYTFSASDGASVDGLVLTADAGGTYEVTARDPLGNRQTRSVRLPSPTVVTQTKITALGYSPGLWSAGSSAAVLAALSSATNDGVTYVHAGNSYHKWRARRLYGVPVASVGPCGRGSKHAISPHVVASAKHYGWWPASNCTYETPSGERSTVGTPSAMVSATDWALAHGFTQEEVNGSGISDLVLGVVTSGSIPDACCPYFVSSNTFDHVYRSDTWFGVLGWQATQTDIGWGLPCLVSPQAYGSSWRQALYYPFSSEATSSGSVPRSSIVPATYSLYDRDHWKFVDAYSGDSGLPIYLEHDGKQILVSLFTSTGGGPSYVKGLAIVRAFCAAAGDTLKVLEPED